MNSTDYLTTNFSQRLSTEYTPVRDGGDGNGDGDGDGDGDGNGDGDGDGDSGGWIFF